MMMKYLPLIALFILLLTACNSNNTEQTGISLDEPLIEDFYNTEKYNPQNTELQSLLMESIQYDLDKDGQQDRIELFKIAELAEDPGDYHRIRIMLSSGSVLDKINADGWIFINEFKEKNNGSSGLLRVVELAGNSYIVCEGYQFPSDTPITTVIDFTAGKPRVIFNKHFRITSLPLAENTLLKGIKAYQEGKELLEHDHFALSIASDKYALSPSKADPINIEVAEEPETHKPSESPEEVKVTDVEQALSRLPQTAFPQYWDKEDVFDDMYTYQQDSALAIDERSFQYWNWLDWDDYTLEAPTYLLWKHTAEKYTMVCFALITNYPFGQTSEYFIVTLTQDEENSYYAIDRLNFASSNAVQVTNPNGGYSAGVEYQFSVIDASGTTITLTTDDGPLSYIIDNDGKIHLGELPE